MWYSLDENYISADNNAGIYVLKNLSESESESFKEDVFPKLLNLLSGLPFDIDNHELLINRSVTEYEVKSALKNESDKERAFWLYRKFSGGVMESDEKRRINYNDTLESNETKQSYYNLIEWMQQNFPPHRVRRYDRCSYASYKNNDDQWTQQFDEWRKDVYEVLNSSLQNIIRLRNSWDQDGCGLGII